MLLQQTIAQQHVPQIVIQVAIQEVQATTLQQIVTQTLKETKVSPLDFFTNSTLKFMQPFVVQLFYWAFLVSFQFCFVQQQQVQKSVHDEYDDSISVRPQVEQAIQTSSFMPICLLGYNVSILLSIIVFGIEFIRKHGWKKYSYIMFDEDGQYLFISILFLVSGKSAVFLLLLILSAVVRLLSNLAILTNNHPKVIEIQQKIYFYDLGDKFARFELFLLFNEVLSFSILRMIVVINFICHRYLVFAQLRNFIMAINQVINQYVPGMLRSVYTKACYYLNQYVTSLSQRKLQIEQGQ